MSIAYDAHGHAMDRYVSYGQTAKSVLHVMHRSYDGTSVCIVSWYGVPRMETVRHPRPRGVLACRVYQGGWW